MVIVVLYHKNTYIHKVLCFWYNQCEARTPFSFLDLASFLIFRAFICGKTCGKLFGVGQNELGVGQNELPTNRGKVGQNELHRI